MLLQDYYGRSLKNVLDGREKRDENTSKEAVIMKSYVLISCRRNCLLFQVFKSCMLEIKLKYKLLSNSVENIATLFRFEKPLLKVVGSSS